VQATLKVIRRSSLRVGCTKQLSTLKKLSDDHERPPPSMLHVCKIRLHSRNMRNLYPKQCYTVLKHGGIGRVEAVPKLPWGLKAEHDRPASMNVCGGQDWIDGSTLCSNGRKKG
jgi:hypothetical protein